MVEILRCCKNINFADDLCVSMGEESRLLLEELKIKVRRLMDVTEKARQELAAISAENDTLKSTIEELKQQLTDSTLKYENLKVAASLGGGNPNTDLARKRINKLVRDIDKCVALLNE